MIRVLEFEEKKKAKKYYFTLRKPSVNRKFSYHIKQVKESRSSNLTFKTHLSHN